MTLDEQDLREGLKFICGTWQVDYVVNGFSNDLSKIPATEFKSNDGKDFSGITFAFAEDHSVVMRNSIDGKEEVGTWEQTGWTEYHYTLNGFIDVPDGPFKKNAETLLVRDGDLAFSIGFLAIGMKKIEEGHITEKVDEIAAAEDAGLRDIVGKYRIAKMMNMVDGKLGLFTREEVLESLNKQVAEGKAREGDVERTMQSFDCIVEFTDSLKVKTWMQVPANVTEEQLKEAIESGEISEVVDGLFVIEEKNWKSVGGKYYFDSEQHCEICGEVQSPWKELVFDENGCIPFADGMMLLERI